MVSAVGRCSECGAPVSRQGGRSRGVGNASHACTARSCEYHGCHESAPLQKMVKFETGEWYCPYHGLVLVATDLLSLCRAGNDEQWVAARQIIQHTLPDLIDRNEAWQPWRRSQARRSTFGS